MSNESLFILAWVWQPILQPLHIVAAMAAMALLSLFAYVRTFRGGLISTSGLLVMRLAMIAALGVLLMGPSTVPESQQQAIRPKLRILLDTSESMLTADCEGMSRFQFVQKRILNEEQLRLLSSEFEVEIVGFDESLHPLPIAALQREAKTLATGRATHVADCITSFLTRIPSSEEGASVVVISDGRDTQAEPISPAASAAKSRKIPIHAIAVGGQSLQTDLAVLAVPMQDYLLPGEPGAILVKVFQSGADQSRTTLTVGHGTAQQKIPIEFNHRQVVDLQIPVKQDEPGQYEYQVALEPVAGEKETGNNRQSVFCEVHKKRIRVLLLEGQPFWDSKFLAQSLRKDEHIELTQITQLSTAKRETILPPAETGDHKIPTSAEQWAQYDVVVLGQGLENVLSAESAPLLDDFVSNHGGHLIFARGRAYDAATPSGQSLGRQLSKLEPVVWGTAAREKLGLSLTPTGRSSQWFSTAKVGVDADQALARLPGFAKTTAIEREKPATIVLARASTIASAGAAATGATGGQPAIVRMTYGRGTVVGVLGDGLWQWSLLPPDKQDLISFYDTFWSNLVRWLAMGGEFSPDQQVALHLSRTTLRLGDPMVIDVVYKHTPAAGAHPKLTLLDPARHEQGIALESVPSREPRFRATLKPDAIGIYQVSVQSPGMQPPRQDKKFNVYDTNVERLMTTADPMSLRMLAEHSGGRFYEANQAAELGAYLRQYHSSQEVPPQLEYVWDQAAIMILLLFWCGSEWLLRRFAGFL